MKLLSENLFEFQKGLDPVDSLGIGRLKMIKDWLDKMEIEKYHINDDLTINGHNDSINGFDLDIHLSKKNLVELPDFIQFNIVFGNFWIHKTNLISFKGFPRIIKGTLECSYNKNLTSLKYFPKEIYRDVWCLSTQLSAKEIRRVCKVRGTIYETW